MRDERRDERELDRRDRDDRRFPREYDSYIGPAGTAKPGPRALDTHRGAPGPSDSRYVPGTPTGATPHSSHHPSPSDRLGPQVDSYSRRSSLAIDASAAKDSRREPGKDEALLASRAEASRERYAPRPSSPPAAVPAFGSNVWRAPALEAKASSGASQPPPKPVAPVSTTSVTPAAPSVNSAPTISTTPKPTVPSGLVVAPPTGPKADRAPDRLPVENASSEGRTIPSAPPRAESAFVSAQAVPPTVINSANPDKVDSKPQAQSVSVPSASPVPASAVPIPSTTQLPSIPSAASKSPAQGPKPRPPPIAPQAALRANTSPQFSRPPFPAYPSQDASAASATPPSLGPRSGTGGASSANTSPKSLPANIPTGPKADRAPMASRAPPMYPPSERPPFAAPRAPISGGPKSMQWVRPGLIPNRPMVPSKREFPAEDRERALGTAPKAPKLESNASANQPPRAQQAKSESPSLSRAHPDIERPKERASSAERRVDSSPKPGSIETRRHSDVYMADASPRMVKPPMSAASSAPEALQDSEDEVDLDEGDFAEIEAKYNRERAILEAKRVDLSEPHLRATTPLQTMFLLKCITVDHLSPTVDDPEPEIELQQGPIEEDVVMHEAAPSPPQTQATTERTATELLTPKNDSNDDVDMEEKRDKSPAPATVALRLRPGAMMDQDSMPDLSALPYLGSGPPTPLSDIEQDRPKLPEKVMLAIRDKLRKSIEPELTTDQILEEYAVRYRQWRMNIRPLDEEREQDDPERQPSAEPSLKATTPDVNTAGMPGLLDAPTTVSGRRGHSHRWATELDLEQVIKESLKTAEEERIGKKERDPRRALADPEKEADIPLELVDSEAQRRRYIDTNFQREPGQGIFVFHYEPPEDDFTEEEHRVMVQNYRDQYAKKWGKLAEILYKEVGTDRTYKDCINHYYATKWGREYKGKARRGRGGRTKRGGGVGRGRGAIANMERSEVPGEDGLPPAVTETGRPRRSAAPTFGGMETDFDPTSATPTPGRARRQTDTDGGQEKVSRRGKVAKEKGTRKAKNTPIAAAPTGSPIKLDRKEKVPVLKSEDDNGKRPLGEMQIPLPITVNPGYIEDTMLLQNEVMPGMPLGMMDRPKTQATARPGPSSYWSVSELGDFDKNVAHFGTDWLAIANHMGTKTHTMIKNQYLRLLETGRTDLEQAAKEADSRRERGDNLGPPPTPTPAPKRRYESTQPALPRQIAPTPELTKSPLVNALPLSKTTPPHSAPSSRFSAIAQAPTPGKPMVSAPGFPSLPETSLATVPSLSQQSPPAPPQRTQPQHHHTLSQAKPQHPGPIAGYFSEELSSRLESRPPSQPAHQPSRSIQQQHVPAAMRAQEHQPTYRGFGQHERDSATRQEVQQEQEAQHRYQHVRRISQEMPQHRHFAAGNIPPLAPPIRTNSDPRSPEHRPLSYSHSRHTSQAQPFGQTSQEVHHQPRNVMSTAQQIPPRSSMHTPPVKEEPRNPPASAIPAAPSHHAQSQHPQHAQYGQPPVQNSASVPPVPKPAAEPRKSNLMSLLNDTETESEPKKKKASDPGPPSHSTTPLQQTSIAAPPASSQALPQRRTVYDDQPYNRTSYAQHTAVPPATSNRAIDLPNEQPQAGRATVREGWQQRQQQQYATGQSQAPQQPPLSSHSGLPQSSYNDTGLYRHRSVFAQHNTPRHNPSPPPHSYTNSPHMHSRTPSISGAPGGQPRHGVPSTTAAHHPGTPGTLGILQPNPYAQVEPPGANGQPGPMGMRPSPHLHTSHVMQQRDLSGRNEHAQSQNGNLSYSNPQTPIEHPSHQSSRGPNVSEAYRPRDPRESHHEFEPRHHSDRDTSRELSQRADMLREQLRHEDLRYQTSHHDRSYLSQRSHTPLARSEHSQPPPLQHPPHSSLGAYSQRPPEEHRAYPPFNPRDRSLTERIREEHAQQQQAAMNRDEHMRREEDRQMRERDAQMRDNLMRRDMRGPPPGPTAGSGQDQRPTGPGSMDWTGRHPQERGWQR